MIFAIRYAVQRAMLCHAHAAAASLFIRYAMRNADVTRSRLIRAACRALILPAFDTPCHFHSCRAAHERAAMPMQRCFATPC